MFDYEKIKAAAYKYKYETALETADGRITYKELLDNIGAVYNSLSHMNVAKGTVAVLLRACPQAVYTYFACACAGFECVSADSRLSCADLSVLLERFNPSVVITESSELKRLAEVLTEYGCKTVVTVGKSGGEKLFPAQFDFDVLLEKNNYRYTRAANDRLDGKHMFFDGNGYNDVPEFDSTELERRRAIYIALPIFEGAGALALTSLLYSGHRCFLSSDTDSVAAKRKKITAAVCDAAAVPRLKTSFKELFSVRSDAEKKYIFVGGGVLCPERVSAYASEKLGVSAQCGFDGEKIRVTVAVKSPAETATLANVAKKTCVDLLYAYKVPKSLAFTSKRV